MKNRITDAEFQTAQDKIDALTRKTGRGRRGTDEENARYAEIITAWETACALPQRAQRDHETRDIALHAVAVKFGLL